MQKIAQRRCVILCLALVAGLSALSLRLVYLQVWNRKVYSDKADSSYTRKLVTLARRGYIIDRKGEPIAKDVPHKNIVVDKYHLKDPNVAARSLACKYIRTAMMSEDKKVEITSLQSLMTPSVKAAPKWMALKPERRQAIVMRGSRILLAELGRHEVVRRNFEMVVEDLARPLGIKRDVLRQKLDLENRRMDVVLKKDEPDSKALRNLSKMLSDYWIQGFRFEDSVKRIYLTPEFATHLIGVTNYENKGESGVERFNDQYLKGSNGSETMKRDPRGLLLPSEGSVSPPRHGWNVQLTLDMDIQSVIERELDAAMEKYICKKGTIIIMDPKTGEILAMASRPHFNLNLRDKRMVDNGSSFAIHDTYEPGSTFKVVVAAAAANERVTHYDEDIFCHWGSYQDRGFKVPDHHPYGDLKFWGILQKSSNIGAWMLAKRVPRATYFEYARKFGFGQRTGIRASGESKGLLRDTGKDVDYSRVSYGYAVSVTPLQVACAYCAIANDGKRMKPHVVKRVLAADGKTVTHQVKPEVVSEVMRPEVARQMRDALATVVTKKGTARRAAVEGYTVGGKTGTAFKWDPVLKAYNKEKYSVSFAGMVPAENPNFVCVVVLDEPMLKVDPETNNAFRRGGGSIAAPVFAKVAKRVLSLRNVKPNVETKTLTAR